MADIASLRNAIQARLATIEGLRSYDVATGQEMGPCAIVFPQPPASGSFAIDAGSRGEWFEFLIEVHVPLKLGLARAQDILDGLISPGGDASVGAAIEADESLGGLAADLAVGAFTIYALSKLNEVATLMAMVPVQVMAA